MRSPCCTLLFIAIIYSRLSIHMHAEGTNNQGVGLGEGGGLLCVLFVLLSVVRMYSTLLCGVFPCE